MSWLDFHPLDSESLGFSTDANELVLTVFLLTTEKLADHWKEYNKEFDERMAKIKGQDEDDSESNIASQEFYWEEGLHRQRIQGAGALALDWLMYSVKDTLQRTKEYFDKSHPPKPNYPGPSWLDKATNEYKERFGIHFTKGPADFARIRELALARNAGIHRDQGNLNAYLKLIAKPRFVRADEFYVAKDALQATIADATKFIDWVMEELKKLHPAKAEAAIPKKAELGAP